MRLHITILAFTAAVLLPPVVEAQGRPDPSAQKAAMQKLSFLAGTWSGEAEVSVAGKQMIIQQTETVQYKLDGVLMLIEGVGRDPGGKALFQALAVISFDRETGTYRIRAWNEGNSVETELKVGANQFEWGFQRGSATMVHRMEVDAQGRWSEVSEVTLADGRKVQAVKMTLTRKKD